MKSKSIDKLQNTVLVISIFLLGTAVYAQDISCEGEGLGISQINFEGLNTTKRRVVDRQLYFKAGDVLQCSDLQRSRQAIEDTGLFKKVEVTSKHENQVVNINFQVVEKRYLILLPYVASSESGSLNYGVRGRWSNIAGLNQRASLNIRKKTFSTDLKDEESKFAIGFSSPQINNSDYDGNIQIGYIDLSTRAIGAPVDSEPFNEVSKYFNIGISRWFHEEQRQQGWQLGSTLSLRGWESDNPALVGLDDAEQSHLGLALNVGYNKLHDKTYSYDGHRFSYRIEPTIKLDGERSPLTQELSGIWNNPVGSRDHTQVEIKAGLGWSNGAYADFVPFQNSLSAQLRGISYEDFEGDRYYYLKAAYLTPYTFKPFKHTRLAAYPSLRAEVFAEVNDIYFSSGERDLQSLAWSVGTGVRWRLPWFVGVQVGAGIAYHSEENSIGFYISGR